MSGVLIHWKLGEEIVVDGLRERGSHSVMAPKVLVRGRKWATVRKYSKVCRFCNRVSFGSSMVPRTRSRSLEFPRIALAL